MSYGAETEQASKLRKAQDLVYQWARWVRLGNAIFKGISAVKILPYRAAVLMTV